MKKLLCVLVWMAMVAVAQAQPRLIKLNELQRLITDEQRPLVVNFWATWCGPCLKEMPVLEQFAASHPDVRLVLVSMDMDLDPNPDKVSRFVARKNLQSEVIILDERNPQEWVGRVDKRWKGNLPATIVKGADGKKHFVDRMLKEGELEALLALASGH
ncbi:MAG: TlpA family protein disulfide reductase [Cyclobacteriaceae bacterium]|nr:TlpA family protein disulfide reductase [Cyclobacteriaceae bacterium]